MKSGDVYKILIILLVFLCCAKEAIPAQDEDATQRIEELERQIEDKETRELKVTEKEPAEVKDFILDYGTWVLFSYRHYRNLDNDRDVEDWVKDAYVFDTRTWVRVGYHRLLMIYGRLKNLYRWRPHVSSDYTGIGDDYEGPKVDMLYADLNLNQRFDVPLSARVGRQYLTLGRGITYSSVHDGVQFRYALGKYIRIKAFLSRTQEFEDNIDYSMPGYKDEGDRDFYGAEVDLISPSVAIYGYGLIQRDRSHECPEELTQNYTYHSEYLGLGITGKGENLSYWGELIKEYGESNTDATKAELAVKDVDAWACDAGLKYRFDCYSHPILEGEFAYGSGDKDRTRVTNTEGGNIYGKDRNFLYFGAFNAGYALAPRISNMYIYKIGTSFKPFELIPYFGKNFALGSRFYIYRKDKETGGIYDIDATEASSDVGQELDFFLHWKVYENFYCTIRYGLFFPGAAYPKGTRDLSEYIFTQVKMIF